MPTNINSIKGWNKGLEMPETTGDKNPAWKGGRVQHPAGYILVYVENHPYAHSKRSKVGGYILEHRFVMEQHIGRYLSPRERIHHINGVKDDNRIENLELLTSQGDHMRIHNESRKRDHKGRFSKFSDQA